MPWKRPSFLTAHTSECGFPGLPDSSLPSGSDAPAPPTPSGVRVPPSERSRFCTCSPSFPLSDTPPTPPHTALLPRLLEGSRGAAEGARGYPRPHPETRRLPDTCPPRSPCPDRPAARCAPGCARPSAARAPGAGAGEERAPPPPAPRPPPPPSPPRPLAERRKPAGSRWPGAPGSGRAAGKHRAGFLSSSAGVAGEVGARRAPPPARGWQAFRPGAGARARDPAGQVVGRWRTGGARDSGRSCKFGKVTPQGRVRGGSDLPFETGAPATALSLQWEGGWSSFCSSLHEWGIQVGSFP